MANKVQKCPLIQTAWVAIDRGNSASSAAARCYHRRKDKVVLIVGPSGTGNCRLSIDLATRFPSSIISNKMEVYKGLDITTNKISAADPVGREFIPVEFRSLAGISFADPVGRELIPIEFRSLAGISFAGPVGPELIPVDFRSLAGISFAGPVGPELIPVDFRSLAGISFAGPVGREFIPVEFRSLAGISFADPVGRELILIEFRLSIATRSHEQLGSARHLFGEFNAYRLNKNKHKTNSKPTEAS